MKSKLIVIPILAVSGAVGFFFFQKIAITPSGNFYPTPIPSITLTPAQQTVSLNIAYSPDKISHYNQNYIASQSALTLLESIATQSGIPVEIKKYSFGSLVEAIDGKKNTTDKAWIYFVNGQSASVGADSYLVLPGDKIEWKYVKPQ